MSDMYVVAATTTAVQRVSEGANIRARGLRDGTLGVADWLELLAAEGRIFTAGFGSVATPLTFLATAALRPDAWLRVPSGTTILPLLAWAGLVTDAGTATNIDLRICDNDVGNGTSTAATTGPITNKTNSTNVTSAVVARHLATADVTTETNPRTILRIAFPGATNLGETGLRATRADMGFPVLVGPASLQMYIAATTTQATGYAGFSWAEVPSTFFA